jgi:hypothetical protein
MRTRDLKLRWITGAIALCGLLCGLAIAANATLKLSINGSPAASSAIVVGGKVFIPLEALQKAGAVASASKTSVDLTLPGAQNAGGSNARASLEGCLGETLFNGVWRVKTLKLEAIKKDGVTPGWGLTVEVRNGTKTTLGMTDAGVDGTGQGIQLAFADATTIPVDPMEVQKLTFAKLPAGGAVTQQLKFYYPFGTPESAAQKPVKFLLEIDPKGIGDSTRAKGVGFSVLNPSLRVRLDCQK